MLRARATYTDDILEPKNLLHASYRILSKLVVEKSLTLILLNVINSKGFVDIITEKNIEGINEVGPVFKGDPIFSSKKIKYHGQPIFAVVATSYKLAKKAASNVKIEYKETKPILSQLRKL